MGLGRNFHRNGFSLLEILLALFIVSIGLWAYLEGLSHVARARAVSINRWRAQVVAESVADIVGSLSNADLFALASTGNAGTAFTASSQPWLAAWQTGVIQSVQFTLRLSPPAGPTFQIPNQIAGLPPLAANLTNFDKRIITRVVYLRDKPGSEQNYTWEKFIGRDL